MTNTSTPSTAQATHCPECSTKGKKVKRITLESLLTPDAAHRIGDAQYRFCDSAECDTVYFGDDGTAFSKSDLTVRVGVKERTSPRHVCYCFDHTIEEIDAEVRDTGHSTVLDDIKMRMKDACWCETKSPQGSCCLGTVGKYVKQALAEHGGTQDVSAIDEKSADCCAAGAHCNTAPDSEGTGMHDCCANTDTTGDAQDKGQRTGMLAVGGSVLSALAASACCWIPLLLIAFGVSAGGVSAWFEQYRWLFLGITAVLLGTGFYFVYFRKPHCAPGSACATPNLKLQRFSRVMLWVATVVVIATAAFPKYVGYLIPEDEPAQITIPAKHVATASVGIEGMTCEACAIHVKDALMKVPGVLDVVVSYPDSAATVRFDDTSPPAVDALASAVEGAGYKADTGTFTNRTP